MSAFFNSAGFGVTLMLYNLESRGSTIHIHHTAVGCFNTNTVHGGILAISQVLDKFPILNGYNGNSI